MNSTPIDKEDKINPQVNFQSPRYDQSSFSGRAKHFFTITNPLNILASTEELERAKSIVLAHKSGENDASLSEEELWAAKELYDSAFHCQTGEKIFLPGRMSFQVPGNMFITGCMLTFYSTPSAVVFWQTANQSFNAIVNYSNRNASTPVSNEQLGGAYAAATSSSVGVALLLNKLVARSPALATSIMGRFVPFLAVVAANCVNIPLMRQEEIKNGIRVETEKGDYIGSSSQAAVEAIAQVIPSRILMAVPSMALLPVVMNKLEKTSMLVKIPWLRAPVSVFLVGVSLTFSTPLCCALFPQRAVIELSNLEPKLKTICEAKYPGQSKFYYNKGL